MSEYKTLNKNGDFRRLYHRGIVVTDPALVIYYMKNRAGICRAGITAAKKTGNAVERNRSRRIIRAAFNDLVSSVPPCYDFVFVARSRTKYKKSTDIKVIMESAFKKANIIGEKNEK